MIGSSNWRLAGQGKKKLKVYSHGILIVAVQFLNIKKYSDVHTRLKTHFKYGEVKIHGV